MQDVSPRLIPQQKSLWPVDQLREPIPRLLHSIFGKKCLTVRGNDDSSRTTRRQRHHSHSKARDKQTLVWETRWKYGPTATIPSTSALFCRSRTRLPADKVFRSLRDSCTSENSSRKQDIRKLPMQKPPRCRASHQQPVKQTHRSQTPRSLSPGGGEQSRQLLCARHRLADSHGDRLPSDNCKRERKNLTHSLLGESSGVPPLSHACPQTQCCRRRARPAPKASSQGHLHCGHRHTLLPPRYGTPGASNRADL